MTALLIYDTSLTFLLIFSYYKPIRVLYKLNLQNDKQYIQYHRDGAQHSNGLQEHSDKFRSFVWNGSDMLI